MNEYIIENNHTNLVKKKRNKRGKFVKIAEKRTKKAIKAIRVIGKLANKAHYQYDETDVKIIVSTLNKEVESLRSRLSLTENPEEIDFRLKP